MFYEFDLKQLMRINVYVCVCVDEVLPFSDLNLVEIALL